MMQIHNHTDKAVSGIVGMQAITVPANGSANVSERKAREMMRRHPGKLGLAPKLYSEADFAAMRKLRRDELAALAEGLMGGQFPPVPRPAAKDSGLGPDADDKDKGDDETTDE